MTIKKGGFSIVIILAIAGAIILVVAGGYLLKKQSAPGNTRDVSSSLSEDDTLRRAAATATVVSLKDYFAKNGRYPQTLKELDIPISYQEMPLFYKSDGATYAFHIQLSDGRKFQGDQEEIDKLLDMKVKNDVATLEMSLDLYYSDNDTCPAKLEELTQGDDPYIREIRNNSVTGKPYTYKINNNTCSISGLLPDGNQFQRNIP